MLHFGDAEGLYGNYINDMGIDAEGRFWVSTSQGLFFTDARRLTLWQQSQHNQVRLQNIRRGSDLIAEAEGYAVNRNHAIRTGWNLTSEVLQMEPLLVDYSKPAGRLYEYRLDGGRWMLVDDGQSIRLSHLTMGRHLLELRLAGVEGSQSMYTIMVLPTTGAVIELLLLVVALVLLWLWWRWRKTTKVLLSERDQIEDALIESEKLRVKSEEFVAALQESGGIESLQKYQKVKIDEEECADIVSRMKDYLEREKVYTNSDLKMKDLADVLHLSAPKLSQVFNLYLGQNYYDFINTYRLQEFKRLISEGEHHRYTITALSERCGFKKSNFFSTFRKVEGTTPVEYLKKQGVKVV
jgi:AraC-like DNA-binding protein